MKEEKQQAILASIEIRYDGKQLLITKNNLNNVVALGVLALAQSILMKETQGDTRKFQQGKTVAADVSFRPPKIS